METKSLSLQHLVRYPDAQRDTGQTYPTVLALHGRGSNEQDLIGLAPYLPQNLLWVSPRGPFTLGYGSFEWFQITQIGKPDPTRLANALNTIDRFIDEVIETYPVDPNHFYLLGFSQGSIIAMSYALTQPQRVTGIIAQSGYIPHESGLQIDANGIQRKPFILTHGVQDPMLPVEWARRSRDTLRSLGANVEYYEFPMGHQVSMESLQVKAMWLEKQTTN